MSMTAEQLQHQQRSVRHYQEYFDNALQTIGERAPSPIMGESPGRFLRRSLIDMKGALHNKHPLKKVAINSDLQDDGLYALAPQFIDAYIAERRCPSDLAEGELRPWEIRDPMTGHVLERRFQGRESFVKNRSYGHCPGRHFALHEERTKTWHPMAPNDFQRRCYDLARERGFTFGAE